MKITIENRKTTFGDLKVGNAFACVGGFFEVDEIFMVIEPDYGLGVDEDYDGYAINLKTGELYGFNNNEEVNKYDLNITASPTA